jgi:hypothetical protein
MQRTTASISLLIALLIGLNVTTQASTPIGQGDGQDRVIREDNDDEENDALVATESQNATNATSVCLSCIGSIQVGPSASGEALRILSTGYILRPLTDVCPDCIGVVVGVADLGTPSIVERLQAFYKAGHAVALTDATPADAARLAGLIGHRGSAWLTSGGLMQLVAYGAQQRPDGQFHLSSHILLPREAVGTAPLNKKANKRFNRLPKKVKQKLQNLARREQQKQQGLADSNDIQALSRIFSATPEVPEAPPGSNAQQRLLQLAESYQSHAIQSDSYGNQVQIVNTVWAARSFLNSADLYYVLQETDYHVDALIWKKGYPLPFFLNAWNNSVQTDLANLTATVFQPSPQTTMEATQDISSVAYNISGSVGWNQRQGVNASVSGGVTITNSKVMMIPPINITNQVNLVTGQTAWDYNVNQLPSPNQGPETIDLFSQWIWSVPFSAYATGQENLQFESQATLAATFFDPGGFRQPVNVPVNLTSTVPLPFGRTFALQAPVVTSVNPTSVNAGDTFTINGTGFYPSLVQAVLIGGTPVNQANITTVSDTQINVVAPDFIACEFGCTVVIQTTQGASNDNVTVSISPNP